MNEVNESKDISEASDESKTIIYKTVSEPDEPKLFNVKMLTSDGAWEQCDIKTAHADDIPLPEPWGDNAPDELSETSDEAEIPDDIHDEAADELPEYSEPEYEDDVISSQGAGRGKKIAIGAVAAVAVAAAAFTAYVYCWPSIFPGVNVASEYKLGGMTENEAETLISGECGDAILGKSIDVTAGGESFELKVGDVAESIDSADSAKTAYEVGRTGGYFKRAGDVLSAAFGGYSIPLTMQLDDSKLETFVTDIGSKTEEDPTQPSWTLDTDNSAIVIDTGKAGMGFDHDEIISELAAKLRRMDFDALDIEIASKAQDKPNAAKIAAEANTDPENAKADTETGEVVDAVYGVKVSEADISDAVGDATEQTYTVPVTLTEPDITTEKLEDVLFDDVLAQTTTYYNDGQVGRTTNVRLTVEACDGVILNPGDEFSYNDTVGERSAERGYQVATIFVDGESVEDYGGGACQSSSTIYMAVLRADLEVTERRNHQFQVSYTPLSQDATVAWGSQDFKFKNDTDYPIKIVMDMGGGSLTCTLYGTKTVEKDVELYSESYTSGDYKYATLYKTVTVNGESTTVEENQSAYRLSEN